MNVFEKLQKARVELQNAGLKKSGENKFSHYAYFELGDFLPMINEIFNNLKLFSQFSYYEKESVLKVLNSEKPEEFAIFTTINAHSELKGSLPIQSLGAMQTYQRRYLYMMALEIVENDMIDSKPLDNEKKQAPKPQLNQVDESLIADWKAVIDGATTKEDFEKIGLQLKEMTNEIVKNELRPYYSLKKVGAK